MSGKWYQNPCYIIESWADRDQFPPMAEAEFSKKKLARNTDPDNYTKSPRYHGKGEELRICRYGAFGIRGHF